MHIIDYSVCPLALVGTSYLLVLVTPLYMDVTLNFVPAPSLLVYSNSTIIIFFKKKLGDPNSIQSHHVYELVLAHSN